MQKSLQNVRESFEQCIGIIRQASVEILSLLDVRVSEGKDPRWFLEQLDIARSSLGGWGAVARRLKLNDAELTQFTLQLRHLQQRVPQYDSGQEVSQNQLITALRFIAELEHLRQKQPQLTYSTEIRLENGAQQQRALAQLRAIELMIKSLVYQAWPDATRLRNHLKTQFGVDRVRRWLKLGDRNDVLSGMLFSEMALMLVDKKEFSQRYASLFDDPEVLTLFVEPRKTLQIFLDDVRQIRNTVTEEKALTPTQFSLLDNYYPQITRAVQKAFDEGRTTINPAALLAVGVDELHAFWEWSRKKARAAGGDIFEVRDNIERPGQRLSRTPEERDRLVLSTLWGAVGVMVLVMLAGGIWLFSGTTSAPAASGVPSRAQNETGTEREKISPRESLSRMGITWDESNFRSAIMRNDTRVVSFFLRAGMTWKLSWTEGALAAGNSDDVLDLLLRYRLQMDELKPCRRFITTLSYAMANGGSLTSQYKEYLQAFCTSPPVVKRQQYAAEQAEKRDRAEPNEQNHKWATIQSDIYNVID